MSTRRTGNLSLRAFRRCRGGQKLPDHLLGGNPGLAYWTHYWRNSTIASEMEAIANGATPNEIDHTADNSFRRRGVTPGDIVYIVSRIDGRIHLLGRLVIDKIVDQGTADAYFGQETWRASDHLLGRPPFLRFRTNTIVPDDRLNDVKFITPKGMSGLAFDKRGLSLINKRFV